MRHTLGKAKDILLRPISAKLANETIKRLHYSGKVVQNSQLHIGVYLNGRIEGAMQFGPSMDKRKLMGLVEGTGWNEFIELNRMAFSDALPRNSESRALAIAVRLLRQYAPQVKWFVSFADATQSGDGAIYRAAGFVLTAIKTNAQLYRFPHAHDMDAGPLIDAGLSDTEILVLRKWLHVIAPVGHAVVHSMTVEGRPVAHKMSIEGGVRPSKLLSEVKHIMRKVTNGATSADRLFRLMGGEPAAGFQLRYIKFVDESWRQRLTVDELPYAAIAEPSSHG